MNILYISSLSSNIASGMNWSVPASVKAQSRIDNVLWINMRDTFIEHWGNVQAYHNIRDFGNELKLQKLPFPFSHPDVVVFEGFYHIRDIMFSKTLIRRNIPYIIIPRCSLTHQALNNHAKLKKKIAHFLLFDSFVKNAAAIQYLTLQEYEDSKRQQFFTPYFIVPNGFDEPLIKKDTFSMKNIVATFIGRIDIYHKGLDLLIDAIFLKQDVLRDKGFILNIYGPPRYDYYKIENDIKNKGLTDLVFLCGEVSGEKKQEVLLSTDLFIMTSRFEGHPMGLIEALAYGIPSLVTSGTNMMTEIVKAKAGWGCGDSPDAIGRGIIKAINNQDNYEEISLNAQMLAKKYNWTRVATLFHDELTKILNKK